MAKVEFDDDVSEDVVDTGADTKPEAEVSSTPPQQSREEIVSDAFSEGMDDAAIEQLASKDEITIADLRTIPGSEDLSDAQLTAAWARAMKEAGVEGKDVTETKVELPFPVYDAQGNKVAADKVTLEDLLNGKLSLGYNAMGKEQRKALTDVIRNASQGHWNEHRYNTVNSQFQEEHKRNAELQRQVATFTEQQTQWNAALTALVMGDNNPMKALVEAYRGALGKTGIAPEGFVPQDTVTAEREANERGMQWYQEVGMPAAIDIAGRYDAKPSEVIGAIKYFIENEPVLTQQRIQEILQYDVPMAFEANGYKAKDTVTPNAEGNVPGSNGEVVKLQAQIDALTQRLAGNANARTDAVREKGKKTPPAGSGATAGAGDSMPTFKNRDQMKNWLRGDVS